MPYSHFEAGKDQNHEAKAKSLRERILDSLNGNKELGDIVRNYESGVIELRGGYYFSTKVLVDILAAKYKIFNESKKLRLKQRTTKFMAKLKGKGGIKLLNGIYHLPLNGIEAFLEENGARLVGPLTLADYGINIGNMGGRFKMEDLLATQGTLFGMMGGSTLKEIRQQGRAYKQIGDKEIKKLSTGGYRPKIFYSLDMFSEEQGILELPPDKIYIKSTLKLELLLR